MVETDDPEEKVGQMMMVGFYGSEPTSDIRRLIEESHAGSVILFAYSDNIQTPDQTARLNNGLQEIASGTRLGIPLLIATDQEGGVVARMTAGATELPGNMALGAGRSGGSVPGGTTDCERAAGGGDPDESGACAGCQRQSG